MDEFQDELEGFHCSSCGAVLVTNSNTIITKCAFCNSSEVIKRFLEEKNVPKKVIPFEITKDESINSIKKHIKQSRFASSEIIEKFNIEELKAVFIPFYISDYDIT